MVSSHNGIGSALTGSTLIKGRIQTMSNNTNDNVQHGIDDNPHNDAEKGAVLGGAGGAAVGAAAGSAAGPVGTLVGAVAGGLIGAGASGAAVGAVDQVDNDNTITGVGDGATRDVNDQVDERVNNVTETDLRRNP
jgi:outer membrane lipoprotein SlyB